MSISNIDKPFVPDGKKCKDDSKRCTHLRNSRCGLHDVPLVFSYERDNVGFLKNAVCLKG
jgi:hypothetical protein